MRTFLTIGAAALVIGSIATDAEARGRRGRSSAGVGVGVGVGTTWTSTPRGEAVAKPLSAGDLHRSELAGGLRRVLPVTVPTASAAPIVRDAGAARPWCESGRVIGSGAGFCAIN